MTTNSDLTSAKAIIFFEHKCAQCTHINRPTKYFAPAQKKKNCQTIGWAIRGCLSSSSNINVHNVHTQIVPPNFLHLPKKEDLSYDRVGYLWIFVNAVIFVEHTCAQFTQSHRPAKNLTLAKKKKDLSYDRVGYSWMFVNAVIFVVAQLYEKQAISSSQQVFSPRFFCGKIFFLAEYYFNAEWPSI